MVATPKSSPPARGFPVLIANHGTHPDPPRYGIGASGVDARPGDYYRAVPGLYASRGFLVVMPDYRGHNTSEGVEFARGFLASAYFTEDVLALVNALSGLRHANLDSVFLWGHSLGGEVTLRALLATDRVRGASLWSTVGGDIWEQAYHYSRYKDREAVDGSDVPKPPIDRLMQDIAALGHAVRLAGARATALPAPAADAHHPPSRDRRRGRKYEWSERLAAQLHVAGLRYVFHSYAGNEHFFQGQAQQLAADRDVAFFRSLMAPPGPP